MGFSEVFKPKSEKEIRKLISTAMRSKNQRVKRLSSTIVEIGGYGAYTYVDEKRGIVLTVPIETQRIDVARLIIKTFCS